MGYNKKVLSEATANLNKRKAPVQKKDIIVDPRGQWAHPGQPTRIPGNNITMQGVPYPVYGIDNTGFAQMMYPGQDYQFQGDYVDEYPMARKGGSMPKIPKKKDSKGYSRSITATNRLFAQNPLTKKTKSKKRKVFDPNAKYYQDGGDISIPELAQAQEGGDYYTFQGTNYMKQDGKWFKDINGTYMPLTKGDVAKRSAVLDAQARKLSPYELEQRARRQAGVSKYNPLTQKTIPSETTQLNVPTSNVSIDKALREKSAQRQATIEAVKQQPLLSEEKKSEILMDPRKLEEYDYLTRMSDPGTVTQKKEQSWDNRLRDYALNPDAAIYYAMSGKDMPSNYQAMIEAGIDPMAGERGGNTVLKALNTVNPLVALNDVQRATSQGNYGEAGTGLLGFIPGFKQARALKGVLNYGNDVIQTSKQAGKLALPKYKNVYRVEHADFNQAANANDLTGRWFADNPLETKFYAQNLKDPVTGEVIKDAAAPTRVMQQRLPEYKIKQNFGAGMPEEARMMSMGRGELTNTQLDEILGQGAGDRFTKGTFTESDLNAMGTAPFLFRKEEGILDADIVNKVRGNTNAGKFSSGKSTVFDTQGDAIDYLFNEADKIYKPKSKYSQYLPFKKGGYMETELTPEEIEQYRRAGWIVEDISIPELTKAQEGMTTGQCPPGQKPDGKGGCILIEEKDLEEQYVYSKAADRKRWGELMDKARALYSTVQGRKLWNQGAYLGVNAPKNFSIKELSRFLDETEDYRKDAEDYHRASRKVKEGKISTSDFARMYEDRNWFRFNPHTKWGYGPERIYSAKEAKQEWMENVPEFADNVQDLVKFITGVAATGGLGELLAPAAPLMNPAATATRAASPFMQAAKAAYKAPIQFGRFGSVPGLTPANIATGYWIGSELMNAPEVLTSVREGVKGEKEWSDVATETGEFVAGVATSGFPFVRAAKELKPGAQAVTKLLDRPFSTYTLLNKPFKAVTTNPAYQRFTKFAGSKYPKFLGQIRNLETMTPADLLKFQTVESTLSNLPGTIENIGSDVNTALDSNLSPAERLLAAGSAGRSTLMSTLGVLPIFRKTAPLYSTNFANRAFLVDNLIKSGIEDDVQGARAIFNASRLLSKQEGGATDTYIDELPQKKIDQLIKQGYKIEYLD